MLERSVPVLRVLCLGLAALVLLQLARLAVRKDPLAGLRIPTAVASVPAAANSVERIETNAAPNASSHPAASPRPAPGNRSGPGPGLALADLPPGIQARVERITQSEILGPVMRPPPMALLGIGGNYAFLRAPQGQTGLLKEGEELGGVKLLQIGTNRVLIEHEGQKKELTIFTGFGSETLLPKGKDTPQ